MFTTIRNALLPVLAGLIALPAAAEEICSGLGDGGRWIGGTEAASDIATAADAQQQLVLVTGGAQYVALFTLSAPTDVRVEASSSGMGDPLFYLFAADGTMAGTDDDSGGEGAARLELPLGAGTYCVAVQSFAGDTLSGFVSVGRTEHAAMTTGADSATASATGPGACSAAEVTGYFGSGPVDDALAAGVSASGSAGDVPFWRFALATPQALTITAQNLEADPFITLFDAQDIQLAENDDFDGLNARIDVTEPLPAGEYCIAVQALSDMSQPITLTLTAYDPEAARLGAFDRAEAAPPLDGSYPVTDLGAVGSRSRQDTTPTGKASWFKIDVDQGGLLVVEAIAPEGGGDPYVAIFDDLGRKIVENDDYNGFDAMAMARILPGTYLIAVKHLDQSQSGAIRVLIERYMPAN